MSFGKWLVAAREAARLTQAQLAERAGISPVYVSALERDEPNAKDGSPRRPKVEKVDRIAKVLGADVNEARLAAGYAPTSLADMHDLEDVRISFLDGSANAALSQLSYIPKTLKAQ